MIAVRRPPAVTFGHPLNPDADEYFPVNPHHFPFNFIKQLPPAPPKIHPPFFLHPFPPPPHLPPPELLHFPQPPALGRPVQLLMAPAPFTIPDAEKPTNSPAPPPPEFSTGDRHEPFKLSKKSFRTPMAARRRPPPRHRTLPPPKKPSLWRRKVSPPPPPPPPSENNTAYFPFGDCTTLMIRNIPNRLRQRELVELLAEHCAAANETSVTAEFDFVYLPVDFSRLGNKGYAFVNFTTAAGAASLHRAWSGLKWLKFGYQSPKIRAISAANLQGKERLREHFEKSRFECSTEDYLPVELAPPCNGFNLADARVVTVGSRMRRR